MERNQQNASEDFRTLTNHEYVIADDTKGEFGAKTVDFTDDALFILDQLRQFYENGLYFAEKQRKAIAESRF